MFRAAPRLIARPTALRAVPRTFASPSRRQISTAPPSQQRRSWKSLFARIGIAGTLIYYYNTTEVFAEEPRQAVVQIPNTDVESEHLPTIEALSAERQKRKAVQAQLDAQQQKQADATAKAPKGGIEGLEEEADQQGAFNPETGEINWDCPCLGGMAHGPCGDEFKAAFSCFVYSSEEPKGMDCIDKFKDMQNCFREYPDIYGSELDSDADDDDELTADAASGASAPASTPPSSVGDEAEVQRKAPTPEKTEGKLSGESKPKAQESTPAPAPPSSRSTSSEKQSSPSPPTSPQGKLSGESSEKPNTSPSSTSLVPDAYKPDAKE